MNLHLLGQLLFFVGTLALFVGWHNIDIAWNMDSGCVDTNAWGHVQTKAEGYLGGFSMILQGWFFMMLGFLLYGSGTSIKAVQPNN